VVPSVRDKYALEGFTRRRRRRSRGEFGEEADGVGGAQFSAEAARVVDEYAT